MHRKGLAAIVIGAAATLVVLTSTAIPATTVTNDLAPSSPARIPLCDDPPASLMASAALGLCATTTGAGRLEVATITEIDCGGFSIVHVASIEHDEWGTTRTPGWSNIGRNCYSNLP